MRAHGLVLDLFIYVRARVFPDGDSNLAHVHMPHVQYVPLKNREDHVRDSMRGGLCYT